LKEMADLKCVSCRWFGYSSICNKSKY
jgi:hypothetical protein